MNSFDEINVIHADKIQNTISSAQKRLWFLNQMSPEDPNYHIPLVFKLEGNLNINHLQNSLNMVVNRHKSLRTSFQMIDGDVAQRINDSMHITIKVVKNKNFTSESNFYPIEYIKEEIKKPFNLIEGPLLRACLIEESNSCSYFVLVLHHIITDGWSNDILLKELSSFYNSFQLEEQNKLNEITIQYRDFVNWEDELFNPQNKRFKSIVEYWENTLKHYPHVLNIPTDQTRTSEPQTNGRIEIMHLSGEVYEEIKAFSLEKNVSIYMTLYAAFTVLIHRFSGQESILTGTPVANRNEIDFEKIIGLFVNTIVIPSNLNNNPTFIEHLKNMRNNILDAFDHQEMPFDKLVEIIRPERDISINPLFQTAFSYHKKSVCPLELTEIVVTSLDIDLNTSKTDIYMVIEETETNIILAIEYNSDLFNTSTIQSLLNSYKAILNSVVNDPSIRVKDISLLNDTERNKMLHLLDETSSPTSNLKCIPQLFEERALSHPNVVAVEVGNNKMTYSQLNDKANVLANVLLHNGVKTEMVIGISVDRSFDMVIALLGVFKAGASYLPLDPALPDERINYMLEDSNVKIIITNEKVNRSFDKDRFEVLNLNSLKEAYETHENLNVELSLDNLAYTIYTSGTTGKPKGVQIPHRGLSNLAYNEMNTYNIGIGSKVLHVASFGFDGALYGILITLLNGGTLIIADLNNYDIDYTINDLLKSKKINYANLTPSFLRVFDSEGLDSLETIVSYGEELTNELIEKWSSPNRKIFNGYGPTETTVGATSAECGLQFYEKPPIGRLFKNYSAFVLDERLQLVPKGFEGELYISGVGLARGYINRPDLTAEKFIPNPFSSMGERMYKTGDIVKVLDDGNLVFINRKDDQLKIRGYRIELKEIESSIQEHPYVKNVFVDVVEKNKEKKIVGYLIFKDGIVGSAHEILKFLKLKLPSYMIPAQLIIIDSFPLTSNGKINKAALPQVNFSRNIDTPYNAPATKIEIAIHKIWTEVLGVEKISIDDDFFDIGGQSLLVAKIVYKISDLFKIDLPIRVIFKEPTISGMAKMIEKVLINGLENVSEQIAKIDLSEEAKLNISLKKIPFNVENQLQESAIFLTGVTGFLGAFILHELLKQTKASIYCLVRASNDVSALIRIKESLSSYGLWDESQAERIIALNGDLSKVNFGLKQNKFNFLASIIDVIYHNGALVNFTYPYYSLKSTNVGGTHEIIKLSRQQKIKPIHFISTLSVFPTSNLDGSNIVYENEISEHSKGLGTGYSQSKWVSEQMLFQLRKVEHPLSIYRFSRIIGHSVTGVCQTNDFLWKFIQCCIQMNSFPNINMEYDVLPVDIAAMSLINLSKQKESLGENFHIFNNNKLQYNTILDAVRQAGYDFRLIPYEEWIQDLNTLSKNTGQEALSIINVISQNSSDGFPVVFNKDKTESRLNNDLISNPTITIGSLKNTILKFIENGVFSPPK
ncbi:amino acid adenylation domain-containing protein [Fictibacillus nanhaiensis]|uniref:non-ribosomal peptide synthetase family protein n=1 Tax=Fictibacillus nanhaiensis TaxID=742169 RepID=UPI003C133998